MTDRPAVLFGQQLRAARMRLGLTQRQMGERMHVVGPTISLYETGQRNPPLDVAIEIARIAGISLDALIWPDGGGPHGRKVGHVLDTTGRPLTVGVARGAVTIDGRGLDSSAAEEFASLYVSACWQAATQTRTDAESAEMRAAAEEMRLADRAALPGQEGTP